MADAPVNFKRPSSRGRKSKRISDLISNHNSSSQAEQSKSKKAKSRPSKYTVLEKRPVSLRVPPSNAQSSKQLRDAAKNQRVYNAPTSDEVAVIWPDSVSSSQSSWPHVLVTAKSAKSHRIAHFYGCYDPLQYPLLFPRGECGWHQGLKKNSYGGDRQVAAEPDPIQSCTVNTPADFLDAEAARASGRHTKADKNISAREYYAYKLQIRPGNMLLRAGRAFLQYITDMYIKVENTRNTGSQISSSL
ncbi:uncharacterized protein LOC110731407 isoform X2 [Chenopodium quinoa]|uniref:uncharacterized protein LOC110731407 isoform X2 n=1 Tax=Chenopodium quinoa TaxID=63459 RepID=UPI000B76BDDB|nr:uncharacterized protein LOC110731407 isoform X2 [Chenopodium quinoa]